MAPVFVDNPITLANKQVACLVLNTIFKILFSTYFRINNKMAATFDPSKAPLVSETLLKSRRSLDELAYKRSLTLKTQQKRKRLIRGEDVRIKRPEQIIRESQIKQGSLRKMERRKRTAERRATVDIPKGSMQKTVGIAVRIHQGRHSNPEIKKALAGMGLNKKYDAVFMKLDSASIQKLKAYDAYVAYGYISQALVEQLLQRRAYTDAISGARHTLSDNVVIEQLLGEKCNILCVSDLVHEIHSVGEHFDSALAILSTFKLAAPVGGFEKEVLKVHDQVEEKGGFIGKDMERFIEKIV